MRRLRKFPKKPSENYDKKLLKKSWVIETQIIIIEVFLFYLGNGFYKHNNHLCNWITIFLKQHIYDILNWTRIL